MVTSISLGNVITVNGKTMSVGSSSNIDVQSIVSSLVKVKQLDETKITDKIALDNKKLTAVSNYRTLLTNLQTAAGYLQNPAGISTDQTGNIFAYRSVSASASDGSTVTNYIGATTLAGATLGSYNLTIDQLAQAQTNTSVSYASESSSLATVGGAGGTPKAGTFSLNGQNITIATGDSLDAIASNINNFTATTNVRADIIKVSDTDFRLKLSSTKTGVANAYAVGGDITVFKSMFTGTGSATTAAQDSQMTLDGLTITRSTNTVSDAIQGVTFTLSQVTPPSTTLAVSVNPDPTSVASKITDFVNAYNAAKTFIAQQQERNSSGAYVSTAILQGDQILNSFVDQVTSELSAGNGSTSGVASIADLGITYNDTAATNTTPAVSNTLTLDTTTLQNALDSNFTAVQNLFEFQLTSNAPDRVSDYSRTNDISVSSFQMNVDFSQPATKQITLSYTDASNVAHTVNATYNFGAVSTASSTAISNGIFGATSESQAFSGLTDGDTFRITLNKGDGTTVNTDLVYKASPSASNEFNSLDSLATAIGNISGVTASVDTNGKLNITPAGQFDTLTFTNTTATDFKGTLGFSNTKMPTGTVSGPAGSALAGLTMIYIPKTSTDSINISITQGIGDRINNLTDTYLTPTTGLLDLKVNELNTDVTNQNTASTAEQQKITDYQTELYNQYSALDAAVSKVNSLLQLLDAQDKARTSSGG